ncbi:hypothetical protein ACP4OV_008338 [Aristida adscensionis]
MAATAPISSRILPPFFPPSPFTGAPVSSWIPPSLPACDGYDGAVLIDMRCFIADLPNSTTASGTTSSGVPIQVTFRAARPPLLSHFCVHCPALDFVCSAPKIIATDAAIVLLRVPLDPTSYGSFLEWDYFIYRPRARQLELLPHPHPVCFADWEVALLSRDDGASYVVACLESQGPIYGRKRDDDLIRWDYDLHLYRSSDPRRGWITKRMPLKEFVRDKLVPLPPSVEDDMLYHQTGKTIAVGGEHGTVVWVDQWRGIFLCDVLRKRPVLQDLPLPALARANRCHLLDQRNPYYLRDVAISRHKDSIKFIEMEIPSRTEPRTHLDPSSSRVTYRYWKAKTWSMAIPVGSWTDWQPGCEVDEVAVDASDPRHCALLSKLNGDSPISVLQELLMAYPTISIDDDDMVYLCSRTRHLEKLQVLVAVDVRRKTIRGVAEFDVQKNFVLMPAFFMSDICRYLRNSTGGMSHLRGDHCCNLTRQPGSAQGAEMAQQLPRAEGAWGMCHLRGAHQCNLTWRPGSGEGAWGMGHLRGVHQCNLTRPSAQEKTLNEPREEAVKPTRK